MDPQEQQQEQQQEQPQKQRRVVDVAVNTQQDALQLLVTFINLGQKRGAFSLEESAKIWECIKMFA